MCIRDRGSPAPAPERPDAFQRTDIKEEPWVSSTATHATQSSRQTASRPTGSIGHTVGAQGGLPRVLTAARKANWRRPVMLTATGTTAVKEGTVAAEAPDAPRAVGAEKSLICHSRACGNPALPQRVGLRFRGDDDIPLKVTP